MEPQFKSNHIHKVHKMRHPALSSNVLLVNQTLQYLHGQTCNMMSTFNFDRFENISLILLETFTYELPLKYMAALERNERRKERNVSLTRTFLPERSFAHFKHTIVLPNQDVVGDPCDQNMTNM